MEKIRGKTLKEWKQYCKDDNVPIKTMKYISCLEERIEALSLHNVSQQRELLKAYEQFKKTYPLVELEEPSWQIDKFISLL